MQSDLNSNGYRRAGCIAIVGCGHVGAVTAAALAALGHHVAGVDTSPSLVAALQRGKPPFYEPGLGELIQANIACGRLSFTTSYTEALAGAEFIFLCVNTPATASGAADLRYVRRAVAQITETLAQSSARPLLVNKSTSPIGTAETIETILARTFLPTERPAIVANPEFLREGSAVDDFFHPDRIVVGAASREDAARVAALYDGIEAPLLLTDLRTAEMIKYVSNGFLATRVSFINEIARLCECIGANIDTVVHGVGLDPRIGSAFFQPGIGYGGSCLPKDVAALCHASESVGVTMHVLAAVQQANSGQRKHAVNSIRRVLGALEGQTIAVWGAAFKGNSEDLRESPALEVIGLLRNEGARVRLYDPALTGDSGTDLADVICESPLATAAGAACVAILTDWPEFAEVDLHRVRDVMAGRLLYDGRNLLSRAAVEAAGLSYCGVGRPMAWDGGFAERLTI